MKSLFTCAAIAAFALSASYSSTANAAKDKHGVEESAYGGKNRHRIAYDYANYGVPAQADQFSCSPNGAAWVLEHDGVNTRPYADFLKSCPPSLSPDMPAEEVIGMLETLGAQAKVGPLMMISGLIPTLKADPAAVSEVVKKLPAIGTSPAPLAARMNEVGAARGVKYVVHENASIESIIRGLVAEEGGIPAPRSQLVLVCNGCRDISKELAAATAPKPAAAAAAAPPQAAGFAGMFAMLSTMTDPRAAQKAFQQAATTMLINQLCPKTVPNLHYIVPVGFDNDKGKGTLTILYRDSNNAIGEISAADLQAQMANVRAAQEHFAIAAVFDMFMLRANTVIERKTPALDAEIAAEKAALEAAALADDLD